MKRILTSFVCAALVITMMAGCTGKSVDAPVVTNTGDGTYFVTEEPVTLSIFCMDNNKPFDDEYPVFKRAAEFTNVSLHGIVAQSVSDKAQVLNMMLSSGDIADIMHLYGRESWFKYGTSGVIIPLNDLIDEYAPNYKRFLEEHPDVKEYITLSDGNIYNIPFVHDGDIAETWFIRQDWLDTLSLTAPTTVDDFYNVMKAFRENDLNGNGAGNVVPYFNRKVGTDYEYSISDLYVFFDAYKEWYVDDNGKVKYGSYEPELKTAMINIAKWYKEGLIDKEIYSRNNARDVLLADNRGGITHDYVGSTAEFNTKLADKIPGFNFVPFLPPGGIETSVREKLDQNGWSISGKNKHPEITMKYFDFFFTEEGRRLMNYGVEGVHYTMVDGKPTFTDLVLNGEKPAIAMLQDAGAQFTLGYHQDFDYERQWLNDIALKGIDLYNEHAAFRTPFPNIQRNEEDEKLYKQIYVNVETLRNEMTQKWVLGSADIESTWEQYLRDLKDMNIEKMIEIQQSAYDKYIQNNR